MKDVWTIWMDQHAMFVVNIVGIAADMRALIDDVDRVTLVGQDARADAARETCTNDQNVLFFHREINNGDDL